MNKEEWKDIVGYEGIYQISNLGNVKSINKNSIMKPSKLPKGYLQIGLTKNGKRKYTSIHRLVAKTFIPNPNNLPCVNHKDCNTSNNNISNLEWVTHKENNDYRGRKIKAKLTSVILEMKKNYSKEINIINKLEKIRKEIEKL